MNYDFSDIEPFSDSQLPEAARFIEQHPNFEAMIGGLPESIDRQTLLNNIKSVTTIDEWQRKIMIPIMETLMRSTTTQVTIDGLNKLDPNQSYLFVSNHRDIVLDAAILDVLFVRNGFPTAELSFGDNLIANDFVFTIAKINKMFPIHRSGSKREQYLGLMKTSAYIHHVIKEKHSSVWIAQRNGRTKDGNDRTEQGLIKMFSLSGDPDFVKCMGSLNIVPVALSYEIEPCADLKVKENYIKLTEGHYEKAKDEDMRSIITGALQPKGALHYQICDPITPQELAECQQQALDGDKNAPFLALTKLIDHRIHQGYHLFQSNIDAYNQLMATNALGEQDSLLSLERMKLLMYAYPVINKHKQQSK